MFRGSEDARAHYRSRLRNCWFCGRPFGRKYSPSTRSFPDTKTVDHLTPLSRGGSNTRDNIVPACWACNQEKGSMTLDEYRDFKEVQAFWGEEYERVIFGS